MGKREKKNGHKSPEQKVLLATVIVQLINVLPVYFRIIRPAEEVVNGAVKVVGDTGEVNSGYVLSLC